jgi:hypothetical protein
MTRARIGKKTPFLPSRNVSPGVVHKPLDLGTLLSFNYILLSNCNVGT